MRKSEFLSKGTDFLINLSNTYKTASQKSCLVKYRHTSKLRYSKCNQLDILVCKCKRIDRPLLMFSILVSCII